MNFIRDNSPANRLMFLGANQTPTYDEHGRLQGSMSRAEAQLKTICEWRLIWLPLLQDDGSESAEAELPAMFVVHKSVSSPRYVLLNFHGNAQDIGTMVWEAAEQSKAFGAVVICPEYPGYGLAPGRACASSVDSAARTILYFATSQMRVPPHNIVLYGRSIGTGPAAALSKWMSDLKQPPAAVVLQSPYTSIRELATSYTWLGRFSLQRWDTADNLRTVPSPVLLLHGTRDTVIPFEHSQKLHHIRCSHGLGSQLHIQQDMTHDFSDFVDENVIPTRTFLHGTTNHQRVMAADPLSSSCWQPVSELCVAPSATTSDSHRRQGWRWLQTVFAASGAVTAGSLAASGRMMATSEKLEDGDALRHSAALCKGIGASAAASAVFVPPAAPVLAPLGAAVLLAGCAASLLASNNATATPTADTDFNTDTVESRPIIIFTTLCTMTDLYPQATICTLGR
jgi:acetyl esterase/lipase